MNDESLSFVEEGQPIYNIRHRAFYFSKEIVLFIRDIQYDKMYFSMFEQLLRSATSIGANLVEGYAGSSKNDFIKFYNIALKSANETKYWLCLIRETILNNETKIDQLIIEANEISKVIATIIINAKK